jgi:hypothetical protein
VASVISCFDFEGDRRLRAYFQLSLLGLGIARNLIIEYTVLKIYIHSCLRYHVSTGSVSPSHDSITLQI